MSGPVYPYRDRRADAFKPGLGICRGMLTSKIVLAASVIDQKFRRDLKRSDAALSYWEQEAARHMPNSPDDFRDFYVDRNPDFDTADIRQRDADRRAASEFPGPMYGDKR